VDIKRFLTELPDEYYAWGTLCGQPRDMLRYVEVLDRVQAMTTPATMHLLNYAVGCLDTDEAYLEVGTWRGATLIGALLGRDAPAYAIDDSSMTEFDTDERPSADVWQENVEEFGVSATYIPGRVPDILPSLDLPPVGVYLFDGDKATVAAARAGLEGVVPLLAPRALLICDDANTPQIREAAFWFCHRHRDRATKILDLPTPGNTWPSFWNGLLVIAWGVTVEE
jgi:protein O-GlcNAc transferase